MGRGRAKAKQTKVARALKYSSGPNTDLQALQAELSGHPDDLFTDDEPQDTAAIDVSDDDEYDDPYAPDDDDDDDDPARRYADYAEGDDLR